MQGCAQLGSCPSAQRVRCSPFQASKPLKAVGRTRLVVVSQKSGKVWGAEEENAAQVRRLINRDRKEFLGNEGDILDKYNVELGASNADKATTSAPAVPTIAANTPNPFGGANPSSNPFGSSAGSPFSSSSTTTSNPFKGSIMEPTGLRPDMSPDPFVKETPIDILKSITLTQVVLFGSFTTIILLMLATFNVVLGTGAIRIAGIE